jgi:hypothetical protein
VNEIITTAQFMGALPLIGAVLALFYLFDFIINWLDRKWHFEVGDGVVFAGKYSMYGAVIIDKDRFIGKKAYLIRPISKGRCDHWVAERYLLENYNNRQEKRTSKYFKEEK